MPAVTPALLFPLGDAPDLDDELFHVSMMLGFCAKSKRRTE
jgi:hypothetical protein